MGTPFWFVSVNVSELLVVEIVEYWMLMSIVWSVG